MEPLSILMSVGSIVPGVLRWLGRDNAAEVADKAVNLAKTITGTDDERQALEAIKANPELLVRYQESMNAIVLAQIDSEVRQLEAVNATMRAEYSSNDPYVRRARPTWLYVTAFTWALQAIALLVAVIVYPSLASSVINAISELTGMWSVALAVIGVAIKSRSDDKARAQGQAVPTSVEALAKVFTRAK